MASDSNQLKVQQDDPQAKTAEDQRTTMAGGVFSHNEQTVKTGMMPTPNQPNNSPYEPDPYIGRVFDRKYEIKEQVGRGGIGLVYRAVQSGLNRDVVIKFLKQENAQDVSTTQRFSREAQALSLLNHSNIVGVYDFGQEDDISYIVMEYIDGISLDGLLKQMGHIPLDIFAPIARQILDAVGEAHRLGIIHRDLKPSNVMLTSRKGYPYFVKVLDFGLVKLLSEESDLTGQHKLVGTIAYLSPEQILGSEADQRVDVYALGVLFYHMLAGQKPFKGRDMTVLYQHIHQEPTPLQEQLPANAHIPPALINLIHRCLSKDPNERPENANALLAELGQAVDSSLLAFPWTSGDFSQPSIHLQKFQNPNQDTSSPSWDRHSSDIIPGQMGQINPHAYTDPSNPSDISIERFGSSQSISRPIPQLPDAAMMPPEEPKSSNTGKIIGGVIAAVALLGIGLGAGALLNGDKNKTPNEPAAKIANKDTTPKANTKTPPVADKQNDTQTPPANQNKAVSVNITSAVKGKLFVNNQPKGSAPAKLELEPGTHTLRVVQDGFKSWDKTIVVKAGQPVDLTVDLIKEDLPEPPNTGKKTTKRRTWRPSKTTKKTTVVAQPKDTTPKTVETKPDPTKVAKPKSNDMLEPPKTKPRKKKKNDLITDKPKDDFKLMD